MRKETLVAPMGGIIHSILANSGSIVKENEDILTIEVMKLIYPIQAGLSGTLTLTISEGQFVAEGEELGFILEDS